MPIQHNRVLIPVVDVRHPVTLAELRDCKRLEIIEVTAIEPRGPDQDRLSYIDVYTERTGLWPLLSLVIIVLLCCSIFVAL